MRNVAPQPSPVFPKPVYARAEVTSIPGVGKLLASHSSSRKFFCPAEDSHCAQTQFSGSVSKTYETIEDYEQEADDDDDDTREELCSVIFAGELLQYYPSRPLALKTSRIAVLKLEAQWQRCALGELTGEVRGTRERGREKERAEGRREGYREMPTIRTRHDHGAHHGYGHPRAANDDVPPRTERMRLLAPHGVSLIRTQHT